MSRLRVTPTGGGGGGIQLRIAVYPNPTSNSLTIETTSTDLTTENNVDDYTKVKKNNTEHFSARLLNHSNVELRSAESKNGKVTFDTQGIQEGLYYLSVQSGQDLTTRQIIIKK